MQDYPEEKKYQKTSDYDKHYYENDDEYYNEGIEDEPDDLHRDYVYGDDNYLYKNKNYPSKPPTSNLRYDYSEKQATRAGYD